jgi:putative transposase
MELRHTNHCVYKIRYHMVFCVKYRKKLLLYTELVNFLKNVCFEISEMYCFEFDAVGSDGDHVIFLLELNQSLLLQKLCKL